MAKRFINGNVYVFSAKKHRKWLRSLKDNRPSEWSHRVNGMLVEFDSRVDEERGQCGGLTVHPGWCVCIHNSNPQLPKKEWWRR